MKKLKDSFNADNAELNALKFQSAPIEVSALDENITEEGFDDIESPNGGVEISLIAEAHRENIVGGASEVIKSRISELGNLYPFERKDGSIILKRFNSKSSYLPYVFCLLSSTAEAAENSRSVRACFELVAVETLRAFLGGNSKGMRVGHPWDIYSPDEEMKRPKEVFEALRKSCGDAYDWTWRPIDEIDPDPPQTICKDIGVDVVVWRAMTDRKGGNAYICGQCATGDDPLSKGADLDFRRLREFLRVPDCEPVRSLVTPHDIPSTEYVRELSRKSGLVFDRSRIVKLLANYASFDVQHKKSMVKLVNEELKRPLFSIT